MRGGAIVVATALSIQVAPASATPPQIVSVEDHLFARNEETLFLLRTFTDNLGRHDTEQTDWLLIHRNIAGGDDRGYSGVARIIDWGPSAPPPRVETLPLTNMVNPYELFEEFEAWPLHAPRVNRDVATLDARGLHFEAQDGTRYEISLRALRDRIADTLVSSRGILPIDVTEGGEDPFDPDAYEPYSDCQPDAVHRLDYRADEPILVHISCEDGDIGQQVRLWILVPPAQ